MKTFKHIPENHCHSTFCTTGLPLTSRDIFIMEEIWKDIKGYSNYQISNLGRIKSLPRKSPGTFTTKTTYLKANLSNNGYLFFRIINDAGISKKFSQHRLIAINFINNLNNYPCVNHINGLRNDNRIENLEWCTHSQNSKHGYNSNNRKNPRRKLTDSQVTEIKNSLINYKYGTGISLAKKFNVSVSIISLIKNNKTYTNA